MFGQRQQRFGPGDVRCDRAGQGGDSGVPWRGHELGDVPFGGQTSDQGVLAPASTDNQNPHRLN